MAKLSARGRTEVARFSKEQAVDDPERTIDWQKVTYALMSDGHVLKKLDVRFKKSPLLEGYKHSYGWKDKGKTGLTVENLRTNLIPKGFKEET